MYATWVPRELILHMDSWSSELAKLAANAMLAQRISSINSLGAICEAAGATADIDSVSVACGLDPRIGPHMLRGGIGWGGSCFQKDLLDLVYIARSLHLHDVASYWESVVVMNNSQKDRFLNRIIACMYGNIAGRSIAVLGFAFKENTSDTKNSPAIAVVQRLLQEDAKVSVYDPRVAPDRIASAVGEEVDKRNLHISSSPYEACFLADAIVLATAWEGFRTPSDKHCPKAHHGALTRPHEDLDYLDWPRIAHSMQLPKFVFDGRNFLDGTFLANQGCRHVRMGNSTIQHPN